MEQIAIASDHAGLELKLDLVEFLKSEGCEVTDLGTDTGDSVDYPDFGIAVAQRVSMGDAKRGVLVCGTGVGMSIVANKVAGIRAALVGDVFSAAMASEHNDANVLVIGGRVTGKGLAREIVRAWLNTPFAGGRHQNRLDKIHALEKKWC